MFKLLLPLLLHRTLTGRLHLQVNSKDAMSTYFWIVPETLGQMPIEVSVVSGYAGDEVRRMLLVEVNTLVECCNGYCSSPCRLSSKRSETGKGRKAFIKISVCC